MTQTPSQPDQQPQDHVMQFFAYKHLPPEKQEISKRFAELADWLVANVPRNPERTKALNELKAAKDCAVCAAFAK